MAYGALLGAIMKAGGPKVLAKAAAKKVAWQALKRKAVEKVKEQFQGGDGMSAPPPSNSGDLSPLMSLQASMGETLKQMRQDTGFYGHSKVPGMKQDKSKFAKL